MSIVTIQTKNLSLKKLARRLVWIIQFEYTAPGRPQRNERVKQKFATLYGRVRAMMNYAALRDKMQKGLNAVEQPP
jgi:hypothetical protein